MSLATRLQAMTGAGAQRKLANWSALLPKIAELGADLEKLTDSELRKRSLL